MRCGEGMPIWEYRAEIFSDLQQKQSVEPIEEEDDIIEDDEEDE